MLKFRDCVLVFFLLIFGSGLYAQTHWYTIHRGGKQIGEISASLVESEHTETYEILSDVTFKVLWKSYNRKTSHLVVYEHESLTSSSSGVYMNDDLEDSAALNLDYKTYHCFRFPDDRFILSDEGVQFTTAKLYFQEPVGVSQVYSERFLLYCTLEPEGKHRYKLSLPGGKTNYYTYEDNNLSEVYIDRTWFNLEFKKNNR